MRFVLVANSHVEANTRLCCSLTFAGFNVASASIIVSLNASFRVTNTTGHKQPFTNFTEYEQPFRNYTQPSTDPTTKRRCFGCDFKCCGKYYICAGNCSGHPCDEDSQCGGGCCDSGNCTESCNTPFELTTLQVGLVAGGSALALSLACTCTCKCVSSRRRRNKKPQNVIINMHAPMNGNPQPSKPHEIPMGAYHASTPPGNPPAGTNYGYQAKFDKTGRPIR